MALKIRLPIAIVLALFLWLIGPAGQGLAAYKHLQIKTVALIPFGTFTVGNVTIDVTNLVIRELEGHHLEVVGQEALEAFLAQRRIRRMEFLDRPAIRAMGSTLNVDALVTGTVSILSGGENPQVAMDAQMVDCLDASVIWANAVSRTGQDYAGFLGLGRIDSLEKLVAVAIKELFENLPLKTSSASPSPAAFEIARAGFSPDVLRSGETALLSMEIKEIVGKVRDIKAFVLNREIKLETRDGRFYGGTILAPPIEGTYPLKVYITDRWNRLVGLDAVASLTVHNRPPKILLSARQKRISPNNDGVSEFILFVPEVLEAIALESWAVEIIDEQGQVVRSEHGLGVLPEGFTWRGVDNQYKPVKDGPYFCRLVVEDKAGNKTVALSDKVIADATPPDVAVRVDGVDEDRVVLALEAQDESPIDYWDLVVFDAVGQQEAYFEGKGQPPGTVSFVVKKNIRAS